MKEKGNLKKIKIQHNEMLQTSNSIDCVSYEACIEVYFKDRKEMLESIDSEIEFLFPTFCDSFQNGHVYKEDDELKEKFRPKIIEALDYIMQKCNKVFRFEQKHLEVYNEDTRPYHEFIFYLDDYGDYDFDIIDHLFSYEDTEGWVHVLNKIVSKDKRPLHLKRIISRKLSWYNAGQDGWIEVEKERERKYYNDLKTRYLSKKNEIWDDEETRKYLDKQDAYSRISKETLKSKINQGKKLDKFDLSLPSLEDFRDQLINECEKYPSWENNENIKNLQIYYYQGYELPKDEYLALIKINKILNNQIPAWPGVDLQENKVEL